MKKRWLLGAVFIVLVVLAAMLLTSAPSRKNTVSILKEHKAELHAFISNAAEESLVTHGDSQAVHPALQELVRPESTQLSSIHTNQSGDLVGELRDWDLFETYTVSVSANLVSAWEKLSEGRFSGVSLLFEENGEMQAHFSRSERWVTFDEGAYRESYCLIWQSVDYSTAPDSSWSQLSDEEEFIDDIDGRWYFTHHRHYDG